MLNPVLNQFRMLTRDELEQLRNEALHVLKIHRDNSISGCLTPLGYLTITQVEEEMAHYQSVIDHANAVLAEWDTLSAKGNVVKSLSAFRQAIDEQDDVPTLK